MSRWLGPIAVAAVAYGWWFSGLEPFTNAKLATLAIPVVAVWALALLPRPAREGSAPSPAVLIPWALLVAAVGTWAVVTWSFDPRSRYPTASSLIGEIDNSQLVRLGMFLVWLSLGLVIARR